jgi:hypothetical protein
MSHTIERKLPEELLDHIVSLCACSALHSLCLTSKTFHRLALPRLYSTIHLKDASNLHALAFLIFQSPAHAALVKSLVVPDNSHKWNEQAANAYLAWAWAGPNNTGLRSAFRARCLEVTCSEDEANELCKKIEKGEEGDSVLALLLVNLPELRKLDISLGSGSLHEDFVNLWATIGDRLRSSATTSTATATEQPHTKPLSVPIDIMIKGEDTKYPNDPVYLATFMHTPNLRSIYGWKYGDEGNPNPATNPLERLEPGSCPVECIELRTSKLHLDNYRLLLASTIPGSLKTFIYEIGCTWAWVTIEHPAIMQGLFPHRDTLESLCLSHEDFYPFEAYGGEPEKPYPCSFTPFTALKQLKVAPLYIWGNGGFNDSVELSRPETKQKLWKALPKNLEELWITRAQHQKVDGQDLAIEFVPDCLIPALELVVQNKEDSFPKLKELRIELPPFVWENDWLDSLASVCVVASGYGIQTTIIFFEMCDRWSELASERLWGWNEDTWWEPTHDSTNRESHKIWIDGDAEDLARRLRYLKDRFKEESDGYEKANRLLYNGRNLLNTKSKESQDTLVAHYEEAVAQLLAQYCSKKLRSGKAQ